MLYKFGYLLVLWQPVVTSNVWAIWPSYDNFTATDERCQQLGKFQMDHLVLAAWYTENYQLASNFRRNECKARATAHPSIIRIVFSSSTLLEFVSFPHQKIKNRADGASQVVPVLFLRVRCSPPMRFWRAGVNALLCNLILEIVKRKVSTSCLRLCVWYCHCQADFVEDGAPDSRLLTVIRVKFNLKKLYEAWPPTIWFFTKLGILNTLR